MCMLHGCTQDPATFAAATMMNAAADRHGFVVVYPNQDRRANPQGCWNWFLPEHQRRGAGEPAAIAGIVRDLIEADPRCTIDPGRVFVAGLSSGGAMAAILAACYPDLFAALAVHSGLAYRSATDLASAFDVMARGGGNAEDQGRAAHAAMGEHSRPVPSIVIHGNADRTVAPANAIQVLRQSMTANHLAAPETCDHDVARPTSSWPARVEGGHCYTRSRWADDRGAVMHELLEIDGLGHAWSGGATGGSHTDPLGPSATEAIWMFFALTASNGPLG
jgi:poly(hydroxyalkanoate) depolymerase family esterase